MSMNRRSLLKRLVAFITAPAAITQVPPPESKRVKTEEVWDRVVVTEVSGATYSVNVPQVYFIN